MRRLSQIISAYVALCLAMAGLVGLSPALHQWIEHGGQGTPHLHSHGIANSEFPDFRNYHRHTDGSSHDVEQRHPDVRGLGRKFSHVGFTPSHRPFALPTVPLTRMGRALLQFLEGEPTHFEDGGGHQTRERFQEPARRQRFCWRRISAAGTRSTALACRFVRARWSDSVACWGRAAQKR